MPFFKIQEFGSLFQNKKHVIIFTKDLDEAVKMAMHEAELDLVFERFYKTGVSAIRRKKDGSFNVEEKDTSDEFMYSIEDSEDILCDDFELIVSRIVDETMEIFFKELGTLYDAMFKKYASNGDVNINQVIARFLTSTINVVSPCCNDDFEVQNDIDY